MTRKAHGFTLIELLLVMAILGILAVVGFGSFTNGMIKSRDTQRKNDLNQIAKALELFNNDVGRYPKVSAEKMTCPDTNGDEADCSTGEIYAYVKGTKSSYIKPVPTDATSGRTYVYVPDASFNSFALYAALENTEDKDVVVDWSGEANCGSSVCNYKLTEIGVDRTR